MTNPPFKLKQRKTACENTIFTVFFDHLVDAEKTLVEDYLVVEPKIKNENGISGIAILPVKDNRFGLVKVYRHPVAGYGWEVPRGFIDEKESSEDAAIRELKEETGLTCAKSDLQSLGTITPEPGIISAKVDLYLVDFLLTGAEGIVENELGHVDYKYFSEEEINDLIKEELVMDATTLTTFYKAIKFDRKYNE
jgi:8-oxo-dGTP pyrophosphatase MutT (NUDIX family)